MPAVNLEATSQFWPNLIDFFASLEKQMHFLVEWRNWIFMCGSIANLNIIPYIMQH